MKKSSEHCTEIRELFVKTDEQSNVKKEKKKMQFSIEKYINKAIHSFMPCLGLTFSLIYASVAIKALSDSDLINKCD